MMASSDHGRSWSEPRKLGQDAKLGEQNPHLIGPVKNKPFQLEDGSILCASSTEHDGWRVHFEKIQLADGHPDGTWKRIGPINAKEEFHALPVVEEGSLVGIVTTTDLIKYLLNQY